MLAKNPHLNPQVTIQHRAAKTSPSLSQDQRLAWIHEPSLAPVNHSPTAWPACSCCSTLSRASRSSLSDQHRRQQRGRHEHQAHPTDVAEPFASLIREHLASVRIFAPELTGCPRAPSTEDKTSLTQRQHGCARDRLTRVRPAAAAGVDLRPCRGRRAGSGSSRSPAGHARPGESRSTARRPGSPTGP